MGGIEMDLATKYDLESRGGRVDEPESKDVLEIWTDEARAASAEARRKGGGGGGVSMPERSSLSLDEEMQKGSGVGLMGAAGAKGQPAKFKGPAKPEPSMLTADEEAQKGGGIGTGIGAGSGASKASKAPSATVPPKGNTPPKNLPAEGKGSVEYKGFKLSKFSGTNVGYAPERHNRQTHKFTQRTRQVAGVTSIDPEGTERNHNSLKEAIAYIHSYHGEEPAATVPPPKKPKPEGATPKPEKSRLTPDEEAKKGSRPSGLR
jgi:hypothetical protein